MLASIRITHLCPFPYCVKTFDGHSFSPYKLIVDCRIEWGVKTIIVDVEVVYAPIDYNFILGRGWIHVMMATVSSESRVILFPHRGKIVMIEQLD